MIKLTPGQRENLKLQIVRRANKEPEFKEQIQERLDEIAEDQVNEKSGNEEEFINRRQAAIDSEKEMPLNEFRLKIDAWEMAIEKEQLNRKNFAKYS